MAKESKILKDVLLLSRGDVRLFRNNVGSAYMGKAIKNTDGSIILPHPRWVKFGLCVGSSDAIGFKTVEITPDMVGEKIAVFVAIETKDGRGKSSAEQKKFLNFIRERGGICGVAKSADDAKKIIYEKGND